jgi:penicillin G amidase
MPRPVRILAVAAAVLLLAAITFWFGARAHLARSVATYAGDVTVPGLAEPVEITFDARGVPHVWAGTDRDMRFATGWLHASERLFQMELTRRMARGELSEVFGRGAVPIDEEQRRLGFLRQVRRDADGLDAAERQRLEEYVAGINAWVAQARVLPPEFVILGADARPWTVEDVLVVGFYQTWYSLTLMDRGADYRGIFATLGGDAGRLAAAVQRWSPATVPDPAPRLARASNSWVIAPRRSRSGAALHAADPHLEVSGAPGLWYAIGLHSREGGDAVGVSVPGLPGIAMGHNGEVAWAFTVAPVDLVDDYLYTIEDPDGAAPRLRITDGTVPLEVHAESILVKGGDPHVVRVLRAEHGPVMEVRGDTARVMRWAGFDLPSWGPAAATGAVMRMHDFATFRRTVTGAGALAVNWTYSDRQGNIGYQLGAPLPVRGDYDTFTSQSGTDARARWRGYRTLDETPHAFNPAQGWLATTNNQAVGAEWPYPIPGYYDVTRVLRAAALLDSATLTDAAAMTRFQLDVVSGNAVRWKALAAAAARDAGRDDVAARLDGWDGGMRAADTTATLFAYWWERLPRELFEDELGDEHARARPLTIAAIEDSARAFVDDVRTPARESLGEIAARAMRHALAERWERPLGAVQTLTVRHPLAQAPMLDRWLRLSRGPFPAGGDEATLNSAFVAFDSTTRSFAATVGPSMRFVMDWADVDGFTLSRHLGQSGNPFSPHFDDFLAPHLAGETWPMPITRARVLERTARTLRLAPAP